MKLYLVTGFLGAGKTTLLKNMILSFKGKRIAVIVNEFGKEGMDGELLRPLQVAVSEIAGGSVFCSCRLDQFEAELVKVQEMQPEVILVEASGLSDPCNVEKILANPTFDAIEYAGSICVVDAEKFEKVFSTVRVCKKQLSVSRLVLVNKADLVDAGKIERVREMILETVPDAKVRAITYGQFEQEWLAEAAISGQSTPVYQTRDLGLVERRVKFGDISRYQLEKFVTMLAPDTHRIKGFVRCTDGLFMVDCVCERIGIEPYTQADNAPVNEGISVIAGTGLPMEKALKQAVEWYKEQVASVE